MILDGECFALGGSWVEMEYYLRIFRFARAMLASVLDEKENQTSYTMIFLPLARDSLIRAGQPGNCCWELKFGEGYQTAK